MKKILRFWHTVKHLKLVQLYYQILLRIRFNPSKAITDEKYCEGKSLKFLFLPYEHDCYVAENNAFRFLNKSHHFLTSIDWNYSEHGKLWTYNLNYFDYLNQKNLKPADGTSLILHFINNLEHVIDGREPYPTSIRGVNWIKFISRQSLQNKQVDQSLCIQYNYLINNLEYHLLGNHLLENSFSLLFGAYYFQNEKFYAKARSLLIQELNEQILIDGGHFELSPMYHKILLYRLLDCINLVANNEWQRDDLIALLQSKAQLMLGWLETISYGDLSTANINDSVDGIAHSTKFIFDYSRKLGIDWQATTLSDSGYRIYKEHNFELLVDVGNIGPDYIPGHAHADTFNFELMVGHNPVIVDTGISTYEKNARRLLERSTSSHNTVVVNNKNQSDVWGGFRVGKMARVFNLHENDNLLEASHNGYQDLGITHFRSFALTVDEIKITDEIICKKPSKNHSVQALLHFHPEVNVSLLDSSLLIKNPSLEIIFLNSNSITLHEFDYCVGFNRTTKSTMAVIDFAESLSTIISIN